MKGERFPFSDSIHPGLWWFVLLGPLAWSVAFGVWVGTTSTRCVPGTHPGLFAITVAAAILTLLGALSAWRQLKTLEREKPGSELRRFMIGLARSVGLLFCAVILLSLVPISVLKLCPQ